MILVMLLLGVFSSTPGHFDIPYIGVIKIADLEALAVVGTIIFFSVALRRTVMALRDERVLRAVSVPSEGGISSLVPTAVLPSVKIPVDLDHVPEVV